ncbi:hypothetical protein F4802DRAFT_601593 [Xylaria palmicola]|nr:hypothetical protein F4802DRAFT_601593 [Xylaria palmicola]
MPSTKIFKGCVVSIAGELEDHEWRDEKVRQWVKHWGGTFSPTVDGSVTHLLCTKTNFDKKIAPVQFALKNKGIEIVTSDWLEDSMYQKSRLKTRPYRLDEEAKKEKARKKKLQDIEKSSKNAVDYVDERYWHVYRDSTYFEYQIQLKRDGPDGGKLGEKHLLTLWESNAKPHNYQCTTLFTRKSRRASRHRFNEAPVHLRRAARQFESFFRKKTGVAWDDRVAGAGAGAGGPDSYRYLPPGGGKPVGLIKGQSGGPSIFGDGNGSGSGGRAAVKTEEAATWPRRHDDAGLGEERREVKTRRKRARAGAADDGEARPAKRAQHDDGADDDEQDDAPPLLPDNPEAGDGQDTHVDDGDDGGGNVESLVMTQLYDHVYQTEMGKGGGGGGGEGGDGDDEDEDEDEDDKDEGEDMSPDVVARARAAAEDIYGETRRGAVLVRDSQAHLIDVVRARRARVCARAARARAREVAEDAEDALFDDSND